MLKTKDRIFHFFY